MKRCKGSQQVRRLFRKDPGSAAGLGLGRGAARAESSARLGAPVAVAIRGAEEGQPRQPEAGGAAGLLLTWLSSFSAAIRSFGSMVPFSAWMIRLRSISPGGGSAAPGPVGQTAA